MQRAGRLGGGAIFIAIKLPPLPFWKLLHYQLPLPSLISHCPWRGSLLPTVSWSWFWLALGFSLLSGSTPPLSPLSPPFSMPESPPTPSQQRQQAAWRLERSRRAMQSPEGRRTPASSAFEFAAPLTPSQLAARYAAPAPAPAPPPASVSLKVFVL